MYTPRTVYGCRAPNPEFALVIGQVVERAFQAVSLGVVGDEQVKEPTVAVVAFGVIAGLGVRLV